jgi:hypothetical protein
MKTIVVLSFDLPEPENIAQVLDAIDAPKLPFFAGEARIAVEDVAEAVTLWLDAGEER